MERKRRFLVAPMDWGLGHAARCVPIIKALLNENYEVALASSGNALALLKLEFPELQSFTITGYDPVYPSEGSMVMKMMTQLPGFLKTISAEHEEIEKIVEEQKTDVVISDNRYGGYSRKARSIFITHQVNILMPEGWKWMESRVNKFNHEQMRYFSECWVPAPSSSFIPELVDKDSGLKIRRIGYLSRFEKIKSVKKYDILVICSGPEPQREIFESLILSQLRKSRLKSQLVRGQPVSRDNRAHIEKNITIKDFMNSQEMNRAIEESEIIISRSGYSTVMDLARLDKKAIFVPTPGQTEQEYVAEELMKRGIAFFMKQSEFELQTAMSASEKYTGFVNFEQDESFLVDAIQSLL